MQSYMLYWKALRDLEASTALKYINRNTRLI